MRLIDAEKAIPIEWITKRIHEKKEMLKYCKRHGNANYPIPKGLEREVFALETMLEEWKEENEIN